MNRGDHRQLQLWNGGKWRGEYGLFSSNAPVNFFNYVDKTAGIGVSCSRNPATCISRVPATDPAGTVAVPAGLGSMGTNRTRFACTPNLTFAEDRSLTVSVRSTLFQGHEKICKRAPHPSRHIYNAGVFLCGRGAFWHRAPSATTSPPPIATPSQFCCSDSIGCYGQLLHFLSALVILTPIPHLSEQALPTNHIASL